MIGLKFSPPLNGMYPGIIFGALLGAAAVVYLDVSAPLDRFCVVGIALLGGQLFGATVGAAVGKPRKPMRPE